MSEADSSTDHESIRSWVEERGGTPAKVEGTEPGGILRIDFGEPDENLQPIEWEEFFDIFEDRKLAFLHQDRTEDGKISRFNKFVER